MKKNYPLIGLLLSVFLGTSCQKPPVEEYLILPQPVAIAYTPGIFRLDATPVIACENTLQNEAERLSDYLKSDFGVAATIENQTKGDIVLCLDTTVLTGHPEGYFIQVDKKGVRLSANTPQGIMFALQSLRQMIRKENDRLTLQQGTVSDYPAFSWRAFMLDEGRYFKGKEVVKNLLDEMAMLKMNIFHWHLTDDHGWRIEIKKYPLLTQVGAYRDSSQIGNFASMSYDGKSHGGFYTQEEIKEVVAYAAARHITVIPEIELPGHASAAIAAYPWLGTSGRSIKVPCKFGVQYDVFNVADERVTAFLEEVMDEVIVLFPASILHIGGDEVRYDQWNASPTVKRYMKTHALRTPAELQVHYTNRISNILAAKGRRMMGWNDITGDQLHDYNTLEDAQSQQKLAPGTIVQFWKGETALIAKTTQKGFDVVNSHHTQTYLDYGYETTPLTKAYAFNPIPEGLTPEQEAHVLGLGCQMWGEFIPTVAAMNEKIYPRIAAYAEVGWCAPESKNYARFYQSLQPFLKRWEAAGIIYGPVPAPES